MNHEDFKKALATNPNTKFKFDLNKVPYTFKCYPEVTGVVTFVDWGGNDHFWGDIEGYEDRLAFKPEWVEIYKEATEATKLQFPCCVATSEIEDEETFKKILDLFVANGAEREDKFFSSKEGWKWFGVDIADMTTQYYDYSTNYEEESSSRVTVYTVKELLAMLPEEESSVAQAIHLFPVGTEVKIAKGSEWYKDDDCGNPKDTKGSVIRSRPEDIDDFCYRVEWDDGTANTYKLNDLVLWEEEKAVDNEGWIEWSGGECPVAKGTVIDVKYRGGDITIGISANMSHKESGFYDLHPDTNENLATNWDIDYCDEDIIAYRLHVPSDTPSVASQEAITERLEDSPSVGIGYSVMGTTASTEPLITITQEVKYTVSIKGITFTFTQEEIDGLAEELLGFTTL